MIEYKKDLVTIRTLISTKYLEYSAYLSHNFFNDYIVFSEGEEKIELLCILDKNFNNERSLFFILKEHKGQNGYCLKGLKIFVLGQKILLSEVGLGTVLPCKTINDQKISLFKITDLEVIKEIEKNITINLSYGPMLITKIKIAELYIK